MQYRRFDKLGFDVSVFGIGCMRLPTVLKEDGKKSIEKEESINMIRHAIDSGVNYIDTAYPYHDGESKLLVGIALRDGYRERVKLATKLPVWMCKAYGDFGKYLDEQLNKLQTDYIDFYLLHALDKKRWDMALELGVLQFLNKAVKSGKIRYPGFSFHHNLDTFKAILDAYDWSICQLQLNLIDENYQAGIEGMRYAASKGIPVVIMEPLKGGRLATNIPEDILNIWNSYKVKRSPVEWAFRWLYNFSEVMTILSGVSTMDQLKDNLRIFSSAQHSCMTQGELEMVAKVKNLYKSKIKVGCTECLYCMPCPAGVDIPHVFSAYNAGSLYTPMKVAYGHYHNALIKNNMDASKCLKCGNCEKSCPQKIPIIEKLKEAHEALVHEQ